MKVFKYCLVGLLFLSFITCGSDKSPQEKEAFEDVLEIVEDLPETIKEAEEFDEEEGAEKLTGSFNLNTNQDKISISSWLARRSTVTFMDGNFSFRSCSNSDCDDKFMVVVKSPNLYATKLPLKLTASIFDETSCTFMYTSKDKMEYIAKEGEFTLNTLTDGSFSLSFNGQIFKGIGTDGDLIDATINLDFEFNFISKDLRTK